MNVIVMLLVGSVAFLGLLAGICIAACIISSLIEWVLALFFDE